jgi:hypothetical protein
MEAAEMLEIQIVEGVGLLEVQAKSLGFCRGEYVVPKSNLGAFVPKTYEHVCVSFVRSVHLHAGEN